MNHPIFWSFMTNHRTWIKVIDIHRKIIINHWKHDFPTNLQRQIHFPISFLTFPLHKVQLHNSNATETSSHLHSTLLSFPKQFSIKHRENVNETFSHLKFPTRFASKQNLFECQRTQTATHKLKQIKLDLRSERVFFGKVLIQFEVKCARREFLLQDQG
jgi:hypothetical protein